MWDSVPHPTVTRVYFKGVGHVRVHQHRAVEGRIKTITAKQEGSLGYVVRRAMTPPWNRWSPAGAVVGIDVGIASFLTTSDGEQVPNSSLLAIGRQPSR